MRMDRESLLSLLAWQVEMGADEAIGDHPCDRFAECAAAEEARADALKTRKQSPSVPAAQPAFDPIAEAQAAASAATDLDSLATAIEDFSHSLLKAGAKRLVFADGRPEARVMIIGEVPGPDEDRTGRPFSGKSGVLLDRMLAAIGLARDPVDAERAVYVVNALPWYCTAKQGPPAMELAMHRPFLARHVALAAPEVLVVMGNAGALAVVERKLGRGQWLEAMGRPVLTTLSPSYLMQNPAAKRHAWEDLLSLASMLEEKTR